MGRRTAHALALLVFVAGCHRSAEHALPVLESREPLVVSRPQACEEVSPGQSLQAVLSRVAAGSTVCLRPGAYPEHIVVDRGVTLWGPRDAIIRSDGTGTTVSAAGHGTRLLGFTIAGSGSRYDKLDSALHIQGEDITAEGLLIDRAVFGVNVEKSRRVALRGNVIRGTGDAALGLRGDGIRFWEVTDSAIERNFVTGSRDLVIRYTKHTRIAGNTVTRGRYGLHLMYSSDATLEDNRSIGNVVGTFIMYSHEVRYLRNLIAASAGAAGIGLGMKESGNLLAEGNVSLRNNIGLYLDTSPLQLGDSNIFKHNAFRLCNVGAIFHSSQRGNTFSENSFRDNLEQVRVEGGGDALGTQWEGNDFDDYAGFDFNGDGEGDVPYELYSLSGDLQNRFPDLAFFRGTVALSLVDAVTHILPLFKPRPLLIDKRPALRRIAVEVPRAD